MSEIARCPACGTAFRVLPDQLKVSNGWVRCGECREVFSALAAPSAAASTGAGTGSSRGTAATPRTPAPKTSDSAHLTLPGKRSPRRKPAFLRRAEQDARWRQPRMRAALAASAVLLALLLLAQIGWQAREHVVSRWPALMPLWTGWCGRACALDAPMAIDRLSLETSDLKQTETPQVLRFSAALHNQADFAVRMPALELTLTDPLGQLLTRKVLSAADLGVSARSLAARSELNIDSRLAVGDLQVAGFTVEIFYP